MTGEPISTAAIGMAAMGGAMEGGAEIAAMKNEERKAKVNKKVGMIRADQIDATVRSELNRTLGNIEAIRASSGMSSLSPTSQAIREGNRRRSDINRRTQVGSERIAAAQARDDERFFRSSAKSALYRLPFKSLSAGLGAAM